MGPTLELADDATATLDRLDQLLPTLGALPRPGSGATLERWRALAEIGRTDLSLARLAEGHVDASAILAELARLDLLEDATIRRLGVWAAEPVRLVAEQVPGGWTLVGTKRWCSGSLALGGALVTATAADGPRLFFLRLPRADVVPEEGSWDPLGMVATRSETLDFHDVHVAPSDAVGPPGAYIERPGFGHGGAGVAACWLGGTVAVLDALVDAADEDDQQAMEALGSGTSEVEAAWCVLQQAALEVDEHPLDIERSLRIAARTRLVVEGAASRILQASVDALGSRGLCHEAAHRRAVTDLMVYVSQLRRRDVAIENGRRKACDREMAPW